MATRACTACNGTGRVKYRIVSPPKEWEEDCPVCHGTGEIEEVYGYDINSAYPFIASSVPCVCGTWKHGTGRPISGHSLCMVRCIARGKDRHLGGLPYRTQDNHVLRPAEAQKEARE